MTPDEANIKVLESATGMKFQLTEQGTYRAEKPLTKDQITKLLALKDSKGMGDQAAYEAIVGNDREAFEKAANNPKATITLEFTRKEMEQKSQDLTNSSAAIRDVLGTKNSTVELQQDGRGNEDFMKSLVKDVPRPSGVGGMQDADHSLKSAPSVGGAGQSREVQR